MKSKGAVITFNMPPVLNTAVIEYEPSISVFVIPRFPLIYKPECPQTIVKGRSDILVVMPFFLADSSVP
jgi:hypothetical protein